MTHAADGDQTFQNEALAHMAAVYRFALRLTHDADDAEDLVQETYLRAYQNWDKYVPGTRAKSWLFTICRNLFLRGDERARRHDEIVARESGQGAEATSGEGTVFAAVGERDPEGAFWRQMIDGEILKAIDALPEEYRDVVILSDLEELAYDEISGVLDIPLGTVKSRLFRGRRTLQRDLYEHAMESGIIGSEWRNHGHGREGHTE
ncbi:MAG: sigma-70 family RNA polymerase sigma factor [Gemmatimonadota bacterium]